MHEFTLDGMHAVAALEQQGQSALAEFEVLDAAMDRVRMANDGTSAQEIGDDEGTRNLLSAAVSCGVRRFVAQSIAFGYADGPLRHGEEDPLNVDADGQAGISARSKTISPSQQGSQCSIKIAHRLISWRQA